jgi:esterase/lipase superfamily enzyme
MNIQYHRFYSHWIGRDMEFKSYGHAGKPVVVFPSSGGRFYEYEDFQMVEACLPFVEQGLVRLYTPDSIDYETWLDHGKSPGDRARRHNDYDAYIVEELAPFIREDAGYQGGFIATGCSMGGYHSVNFFFRHPDVFDTLIALSGIYDARFFVGEALGDRDVYLNSPVDYLAGMDDPWYLERYRQNNIIICTGLGAWEEESIQYTRHMEWVLAEKNVPSWIDYWGHDVNHDWPWWRIQMAYFLDQLHQQGKL